MSISYENFVADDEKEMCCAYCGAILEDGDNVVIDNKTGEVYCEDCFDDNYTTCERCGAVVDNDHLNAAYDENECEVYVCDDCLDSHYTRCDDCGNYCENTFETHDGRQICYDCLGSNYFVCENCGFLVHADDASDLDGDYYCPNCASDIKPRGINDYDYKPTPIFYGGVMESHVDRNANLYMGIELEIDKGNNLSGFCEDVADIEEVYLKHDGSLDCGVEIVSHPCTLEYHKSHMWDEIIGSALEYGFKSHNAYTCGLHVHINKDYFGCDEIIRDFNIAKLVLIVNRFWDSHLKAFSRRTDDQLESWAKNNKLNAAKDDTREDVARKLEDKRRSEGRYVNVNLQNTYTVELRFFRGTLKKQTFYAALELTQILADMALSIELDKIDLLTWDDITRMARDRGYTDFIGYCDQRHIGSDKKAPEKVVEEPIDVTTNVNYRKKPPFLRPGDVVRIAPNGNIENIYGLLWSWSDIAGRFGVVVSGYYYDGYYRVVLSDGHSPILNARYDFDIIAHCSTRGNNYVYYLY